MAEADKNRIFLDRTSDHYVMAEEIASYCKMKIITEALEYVRKYAQAHEWDLSDLEE